MSSCCSLFAKCNIYSVSLLPANSANYNCRQDFVHVYCITSVFHDASGFGTHAKGGSYLRDTRSDNR